MKINFDKTKTLEKSSTIYTCLQDIFLSKYFRVWNVHELFFDDFLDYLNVYIYTYVCMYVYTHATYGTKNGIL